MPDGLPDTEADIESDAVAVGDAVVEPDTLPVPVYVPVAVDEPEDVAVWETGPEAVPVALKVLDAVELAAPVLVSD